jgi:hypothetical protein
VILWRRSSTPIACDYVDCGLTIDDRVSAPYPVEHELCKLPPRSVVESYVESKPRSDAKSETKDYSHYSLLP